MMTTFLCFSIGNFPCYIWGLKWFGFKIVNWRDSHSRRYLVLNYRKCMRPWRQNTHGILVIYNIAGSKVLIKLLWYCILMLFLIYSLYDMFLIWFIFVQSNTFFARYASYTRWKSHAFNAWTHRSNHVWA